MKISLQQIYDQCSGKLNEDEWLIRDGLFAVFDGASSLVPYVNEKGETGAKLAAKIAKKAFSKNDKPLDRLAEEANNKILEEMQKGPVSMYVKKNSFGQQLQPP